MTAAESRRTQCPSSRGLDPERDTQALARGLTAYSASSGNDPIEEMTPGAVLDFEDPGVGVEAQFPREAFLDLRLRGRLLAVAAAEQPIRWMRIVEGALRRRTKQLRRAVEPVQLHENGPSLLSTAPPHGGESSFDVAAAYVGRDPDGRFQAHAGVSSSCLPSASQVLTTCVTRDESPRPFPYSMRAQSRATRSYSSARPVIAASSRTTRSVAWPVIGNLRSRSNFSIAVLVSASMIPVALICP
jgi:hypothetical protein